MTEPGHEVLRLWIRPEEGGPMVAVDSLTLDEEGVIGDHTHGSRRHLTLIFENDWGKAGKDLGESIDPAGRRANVLLSGGNGLQWLASEIEIGPVRLEVHGITHPCEIMDSFKPGLREALKSEGRGGIWGRVKQVGTIHPGDKLNLHRRAS